MESFIVKIALKNKQENSFDNNSFTHQLNAKRESYCCYCTWICLEFLLLFVFSCQGKINLAYQRNYFRWVIDIIQINKIYSRSLPIRLIHFSLCIFSLWKYVSSLRKYFFSLNKKLFRSRFQQHLLIKCMTKWWEKRTCTHAQHSNKYFVAKW